MRIHRIDQRQASPSDNPIFIGDVSMQQLVQDADAALLRVTSVTFHDGARNKWHRHEADQVLVVTSGEGIIANDGGEKPISTGDVVLIPAGERHWHGAQPGKTMSHLSIVTPGALTIEE